MDADVTDLELRICNGNVTNMQVMNMQKPRSCQALELGKFERWIGGFGSHGSARRVVGLMAVLGALAPPV